MSAPEKLNLWDRMFNRYRRDIINRGIQGWASRDMFGCRIEGSQFKREFVDYKITDRVTGSERIEREYIN